MFYDSHGCECSFVHLIFKLWCSIYDTSARDLIGYSGLKLISLGCFNFLYLYIRLIDQLRILNISVSSIRPKEGVEGLVMTTRPMVSGWARK